MPTLNFLSPKDEEKLSKYRNSNYYDFYKSNDEKSVYDTAKVLRNEAGLPKAKFNPEEPETYKNIINTKPRAGSLLDLSAMPQLDTPTYKIGKPEATIWPSDFWLWDSLKATFKDTVGKTAKEWLRLVNTWVARASDVAWTQVKRAVAIPMWVASLWLNSLWELWDAIREDRDFDSLRVNKEWQKDLRNIDYIFWIHSDSADVLNFKTAQEKRNDILSTLPIEEQKQMKDSLNWWSLLADVTWWIAWWLLTWGAVTKWLWAVSALGGKAWQIASATQKVLNKTPSALAKLWALNVAAAVPYYATTGKWIFEWDQAATEWAWIAGASLLFRSVGKFLNRSQVEEIIKNPEYKEWVAQMTKQLKEEGAIKVPKINDDVAKAKWHKLSSELSALQTEGKFYKYDDADAGYTPKFEIINEWVKDWIAEFKGIDEWHLSFQFSDEIGKLQHWKKYDPSRPIMVHYPIEDWKKLWGKDFLQKEVPEVTTMKGVVEDVTQKETTPVVNPEEFVKQLAWKKTTKEKIVQWAKTFSPSKILNDTYNKFTGLFVNNKSRIVGETLWDRGIKWTTLWGAQRANRDVLDAEDFNKKTNFIKDSFKKFTLLNEDEFDEFNAYVWAKSRLNQASSYESANPWKTLNTTIEIDWRNVPYTKEQMQAVVDRYDAKYSELSAELNRLNKSVLDYEEMSWIRTPEMIENYLKANPDYIPASLSDDVLERMMNGKMTMSEMAIIWKKTLTGWSEELAFSKDHINNAYKSLMARMHIASKNNKVNTLRELDKMGIIEEVKPGKIIERKWYKTIEQIVGWERKLFAMPEHFVDYIEDTNALSSHIWFKIASFPATVVKSMATGRFAPMFQIMNTISEAVNWTMQATAKYWLKGGFRFAKNMLWWIYNWIRLNKLTSKWAWDFTDTEAWKKAVEWLMDFFWWSFSKINLITQEMNWTSFKKLWGSFSPKSSKTFNAIVKGADFGSALEKYSSRMPMFQVGLRDAFEKAWVDIKEFDKIVKEAGFTWESVGSIPKLTKALLEKWIDPRLAGSASKWIFNYTVGSRAIREISRYIPYLSTSVAGTTAIKELIEKSPRKFLAISSLLYLWADTMLAYNSWNEGVLGLFEPDTDKQNRWASAPDWMKHSIGFQSFSDDEMTNTPLFKNVSLLNWIYPIVSEQYAQRASNWEPYDWNGALWKVMKDVTYFYDSSKNFDQNFKSWLSSISAFKPAIEVAFNEDLFTGGKVYNENISRYPLYDNKKASQADKSIALWLTMIKKKEDWEPLVWPDWLIEGGVSPNKVARYMNAFDPQSKLRKAYDFAKKGEITPEIMGRKFKTLLTRTYQNGELMSKLYEVDPEIEKAKQQNALINMSFDKVKSQEDLNATLINLAKTYAGDEKKMKVIEDNVKDKILEFKYGKEVSVLEKMNNDAIASYLDRTYWDNKLMIVKILSSYQEAWKAWLVSKDKVKNVMKELLLRQQKKTQEGKQ